MLVTGGTKAFFALEISELGLFLVRNFLADLFWVDRFWQDFSILCHCQASVLHYITKY